MTVLCGGCTVFFLGTAILAPFLSGGNYGASNAVGLGISAIIVGGIPTAVGVALFLWGRSMKRSVDARSRRNLGNTAS